MSRTYNLSVAYTPGEQINFQVTDSLGREGDPSYDMQFGSRLTLKVTSIEGSSFNSVRGLYLCTTPQGIMGDIENISATITSGTLSVGNTFSYTIPSLSSDIIAEKTFYLASYCIISMGILGELRYIAKTAVTFKMDPAYKPKVTITSIEPYDDTDYNGLLIAGVSKLKVNASITHNVSGDTATLSPSGASCGTQSMSLLNKQGTDPVTVSYALTSVNVLASGSDYYASVTVTARDSRGRTGSSTTTQLIKGYHLPRLSSRYYVSRCDQEGAPDGLGNYGHLYTEWDVESIDGSNELIGLTAILNENTILTPSFGSIDEGYIEYVFPLDISLQGNIKVELIDYLQHNEITGIVVPKGAMPMSLFDNGADIGVAYGRMATSKGVWCYLPFYLLSSDANSGKVFQLKVDDSGQLSTELVRDTNPTYSVIFEVGSSSGIYINGQSLSANIQGTLYAHNESSWDVVSQFSARKVISLNEQKEYKLVYTSNIPSTYVSGYKITRDNVVIQDGLEYVFTADYGYTYNVVATYRNIYTVTMILSNMSYVITDFDPETYQMSIAYPVLAIYYVNQSTHTETLITQVVSSMVTTGDVTTTVQLNAGKYKFKVLYTYYGIISSPYEGVEFTGKYYKNNVQVSTAKEYTVDISSNSEIKFVKD